VTSRKTYLLLAALEAGDAVACAVPVPYIVKALEDLRVPVEIHGFLALVKAAAALGLVSVVRFPGVARLTTAMLTLYFVLAVGAHVRVRDRIVNRIPSVILLATFAVMTAKGPD